MPAHVHRWMRYIDPVSHDGNHWCIDGDTDHHPEPCADADAHTGDHTNDVTGLETWPVLS
jgi:hypothetical protein